MTDLHTLLSTDLTTDELARLERLIADGAHLYEPIDDRLIQLGWALRDGLNTDTYQEAAHDLRSYKRRRAKKGRRNVPQP